MFRAIAQGAVASALADAYYTISSMWNNTGIPLAHLITFRCYGTWLHGDERGSIDRNNNRYKEPYRNKNEPLKKFSEEKLKSPPVSLDAAMRKAVEMAVREVCEYRKWELIAINVRTNHVHIVVSIGESKSSFALNSFKSYSTRKMREMRCWKFNHSPWASRGSKRFLWNEKSIENAADYVINGQGNELPDSF